MRNWDPLLSENQDQDNKQAFDLNYKSGSSSSSGGITHQCEWERDWDDVRRTTDHLGLSRHKVGLVDFTKEYWSKVFEPAIGVWEGGGTPNPDIDCNRQVDPTSLVIWTLLMRREIKFGSLLDSIPKDTPSERHFLATGTPDDPSLVCC